MAYPVLDRFNKNNLEPHNRDEDEIENYRRRLNSAPDQLLVSRQQRKNDGATVVLDQASVGRLPRVEALQQPALTQIMNRGRSRN